MKYDKVIKARFISRKNRFEATVELDGVETLVHVKNTGRCKELLLRGATIYLSVSDKSGRKTPYDLIAVIKRTEKGEILINMDSQAPNKMAAEWMRGNACSAFASLRAEYPFGDSRIDFLLTEGERKALVEVKGVTLEKEGVAMFPDAPTERGRKHIRELIRAKKEGYDAYILFVIQLEGVTSFRPNSATDPEFTSLLKEAKASGVKLLAYKSRITPETAEITDPVSIYL